MRSPPPEGSRATSARLAALYALFAAGTPTELDAARRRIAELPAGLGRDLAALLDAQASRATVQLAAHAAHWQRYVRLREKAVGGSLPASDALDFAREPGVARDPLLWAPALQLAGYVSRAKGSWREAQRLDLEVLRGCERSPCAVETQAIALDELAEAAGRDGDFAEAHRLQDRAEALLAGVDARKQLAELHGKRSALLREERRFDEAAHAAALALRELADDRIAGAHAQEARATALGHLGDLSVARGQRHAAADLHEAALSLARAAGAADLQADTARALAGDELELGRAAAARRRLEDELRIQQEAGRTSSVASLALRLSSIAVRAGDAHGALAAAESGLEAAAKGSWGSTAARLHLARARALHALGREDQARDELQRTVDEVARSARTVADPEAASALAASAEEAAAELALASARAGKPAEELLLPLDSLRAAALGTTAAGSGWSQELPPDACVYALLPAEAWTLAVEVSRGGGGWHLVEAGKARLAALLEAGDLTGLAAQVLPPLGRRCSRDGELWLFAPAPLDRPEMAALPYRGGPLHAWAAVGLATTLLRALAPEPAAATRSALLVSDAQVPGDPAGVASALPGVERERAALSRLLGGAEPQDLSGSRATPEAVLRAAGRVPLVHFAVHGFDTASGGYLQLAGDAGRLAARDVAGGSFPGARVVLAACDAAAPGARSLSWAFARAGALAIAAASGRASDAAAASWAERFYAALARGERFAPANHAALLAVPDVLVVVTK